jgi:hypothetical protein
MGAFGCPVEDAHRAAAGREHQGDAGSQRAGADHGDRALVHVGRQYV